MNEKKSAELNTKLEGIEGAKTQEEKETIEEDRVLPRSFLVFDINVIKEAKKEIVRKYSLPYFCTKCYKIHKYNFGAWEFHLDYIDIEKLEEKYREEITDYVERYNVILRQRIGDGKEVIELVEKGLAKYKTLYISAAIRAWKPEGSNPQEAAFQIKYEGENLKDALTSARYDLSDTRKKARFYLWENRSATAVVVYKAEVIEVRKSYEVQ